MRHIVSLAAIIATVAMIGVPAFGQTCTDDLMWMETSSSPNITPCDTWVHGASIGADDWAPWLANGFWWWFANGPTTTTDKWIYNGPFVVGAGTIIFVRFQCRLDPRYDGGVFELSYDDGATWIDVITTGGTLSPMYNTTIAGGVLCGRQAYSGTIEPTTLTVNLTHATPGNALFRFRMGTDNAIEGWGAAISQFVYWQNGLTPPSNGTGTADNTTTHLSWSREPDPLVVASQVSDNGGPWTTTAKCHIQFTGLTNGAEHTYTIRNVDGNGNVSASITVGPLTPTCTEALSMTWIDAAATGGTDVELSWESQTTEIPCGNGTTPVDSYQVYRSVSPTGPWTLLFQGSGLTTFTDPWALVDGNNYYYIVITYKNGIAEQLLPGSDPPPT
ncbi:MAG: hypothetical protein WC246_00990 [Candidatus Paceibacterota bacterium]|jgi:hypothetical protein